MLATVTDPTMDIAQDTFTFVSTFGHGCTTYRYVPSRAIHRAHGRGRVASTARVFGFNLFTQLA